MLKVHFVSKLLLFAVLLLMVSCQSDRDKKTIHFFEKWMHKELKFPEKMAFTIQGVDTINFDFNKSKYKLVTSIKNNECLSCNLRLKQWEHTIAEINNKTKRNVPVLFFLHPNSSDELKSILKKENFQYPICIDMRNEFDSINNITDEEISFRSFLIDENNRVIGIGSPVITPAVKDLYVSIINDTEYENDSQNVTSLHLSKEEVNFGDFFPDEIKEEQIWVKNTGSYPLTINGYDSSCGCVELIYDEKPLMKGDSVAITVKYTPDTPGYFRKVITIKCNVADAPTISVYGNVK